MKKVGHCEGSAPLYRYIQKPGRIMFKKIALPFVILSIVFCRSLENQVEEQTVQSFGETIQYNIKVIEISKSTTIDRITNLSRSGDFALICQNDDSTYNANMENYIYSPEIDIPEGDQVDVDFLLKGSFLDTGLFPDVDFFGIQLTPDSGESWFYASNPYGDPELPNYVYSDAPENWSWFSETYSTPIDIDDYAGITVQFRFFFHSDEDEPIGEGLFLDDFSVILDGEATYFESFEDSTMSGWESQDQTSNPPAWHQDTYGAYGNSGQSWWMGDPEIGSNGGYLDHWYQVLDTPPITLPASDNLTITFDQKRAIEGLCTSDCPNCQGQINYDGWDAVNIRISSDGGESWEILTPAVNPYNSSTTYSFGFEFNEGCNIPGWGGPESNPSWSETVFDIPDSYQGEEVMVRFAFSSDPAYSTSDNQNLTGVWVDNINVADVFTNDGEDGEGFNSQSLVPLGGDLWHVGFVGVPLLIPTPQNVVATSFNESVHLSWNAAPSASYEEDWVIFDDGSFEDAIQTNSGSAQMGTLFDMPFGVETVVVHSASVFGYNGASGSTVLIGYPVVGGIPSPTPLHQIPITTSDDVWTEIALDWTFESAFLLCIIVDENISIPLDTDSSPSSYSWVNLGGWSTWRSITEDEEGLPDGEFGIRAQVSTSGGTAPTFNVYRDPGISGTAWQLMWTGSNISTNEYDDNMVDNGTEYCYKITAIYDTLESNPTDPVCAMPESDTIYEIAYDDGSAEAGSTVGTLNFYAVKFTPFGYPADLYRTSIYTVGSTNGVGLLHVWDDDGENGMPGTILLESFPITFVGDTWKQILLSDLNITITEGSFYIGVMETDQTPNFGVDMPNTSTFSYISIDNTWYPFADEVSNAAIMIRAELDSANVLGIDDGLTGLVPESFGLKQNFPNPFNPTTTIEFDLASGAFASIALYNVTGREVKTLVNRNLQAGHYGFGLNAGDLPSGLYFYKLTAQNTEGQMIFSSTKKMVLMK